MSEDSLRRSRPWLKKGDLNHEDKIQLSAESVFGGHCTHSDDASASLI